MALYNYHRYRVNWSGWIDVAPIVREEWFQFRTTWWLYSESEITWRTYGTDWNGYLHAEYLPTRESTPRTSGYTWGGYIPFNGEPHYMDKTYCQRIAGPYNSLNPEMYKWRVTDYRRVNTPSRGVYVDTIQAEDGTYPDNGIRKINGVTQYYWYVKDDLAYNPPNISVNINGQYRQYDEGFVKINNTWRQIDEIYTKINGVWRKSE